jgi:hypothetical protein
VSAGGNELQSMVEAITMGRVGQALSNSAYELSNKLEYARGALHHLRLDQHYNPQEAKKQ